MNFEKIEQAYGLLLENVQLLQNQLVTNAYDALIEQNVAFVERSTGASLIGQHHEELRNLHLTAEEWRRAFQFLLMKLQQTEPLQQNHQFTPDSIGFILTFLLDELLGTDTATVLEIGSGTGNLAQTMLQHSQKNLDYLGIEVDDLLIDLSASMAEIIGTAISFVQGDAVRPQILKESRVIVSDLPVGFYPDDRIASRYQVAASQGHTYAHHLLMEQSLKYLEADGYAIFLAPTDLLTSEQSSLLKKWLTSEVTILAIIALPSDLFGSQHLAKSIFVLKKKMEETPETFVYPLRDVQDPVAMRDFLEKFKKWKIDNAI